MTIPSASSPKTPGCVLKPGETVSDNFEPSRRFIVFASGAITGAITLWGIPREVLEDDDITDKSTYWSELEPGFQITSTDKAGAFDALSGFVVQARAANADAARYLFWSHAY